MEMENKQQAGMTVEVAGEALHLYPQRAIGWPAQKAVMIADLHLGKVNHFRRSGIPVPSRANEKNIEMLIELINAARPERVICLGDLFHSHYNTEWEMFGEVVRHFTSITFELVIGNHDIMSDVQYERKGIHVCDRLALGPFVLTHHPLEAVGDDVYNLAGHIHPAIRLRGKGRQAETLPCFYFGQRQGFLPAFGMFTGVAHVHPKKQDRVYVIVDHQIIAVR